jgi:hypothetical protein
MSQPATGTTYKEGGFGQVDNRFYDRGPLAAVLIRDYRGSATSLAPYSTGPTINFSPFAQNGELRDDLFAVSMVDGEWAVNGEANEGWWGIGAMDEKGGPQRTSDTKDDDAMILQSNWPFDTDLISQSKTVEFTAVEALRPLLIRLRMNLPISDPDGAPLVEDPGAADFVLSQPVDAEPIERQLLLIFARKKAGDYLYHVEGYPLVKLTKIGNFRRSKTDADAPSLAFRALPDPYHVDLDASDPDSGVLVPALYSEWIGGPAWDNLLVTSGSS